MAFKFFMQRKKTESEAKKTEVPKVVQKPAENIRPKIVEKVIEKPVEKSESSDKKGIYAFIDASNLFWGGKESIGFKINYKRLIELLATRFSVEKSFYYGGIRTFGFEFSVLDNKSLDLAALEVYLKEQFEKAEEKDKFPLEKSLNKVNFYRLLESYGYTMKIKPAKVYYDEDDENQEKPLLKANCDVDMTFDMMRWMQQYAGVVALTGDGDFAPVLSYLKSHDRSVTVVSRWDRTAKEIREVAGENFADFEKMRSQITLRY
jgi:uncharacterized LabA/DUF88 family protein